MALPTKIPHLSEIVHCTIRNRQGKYLRPLNEDEVAEMTNEVVSLMGEHWRFRSELIDEIVDYLDFVEKEHWLTPQTHLLECAA